MYLTSRETLDGLRREWNDLLRRSHAETVFSSWEWQNAWWQSFADGAEPYFITIRDGSRLLGIVPLVKRDGVLSFAGGMDVSDYLDVIAEEGQEEQVLRALLEYLCTVDWDRIELHFLRQDSPTLALLPQLAGERSLAVTQQTDDVCPFINLPQDWDAYLNTLSKKDRHELRRKIRRLEAQDLLKWIVVPSDEISETDLDDFMQLCRQSKQEKALFMDQRMEEFFRSSVSEVRPLNVVRLYFMEIDGRRVSAAMCFNHGQELWLYNSGYDPAYAPLSVGLLLKARCIHDAIERGKSRFDFLRGRERYKYDLGGIDAPVVGLTITPR